MPLLVVLGLCGLVSGLAARVTDPLVTSVARDFSAPVTTVALLATAFTLPFSLSQPLLGPLGDAVGKTTVLKTCTWLLALLLLAGAAAPSLDTLFASRIAAGMAGGGIFPLVLATIGDRFPVQERHVAISHAVGANLFGQLLGAFVAGALANRIGWRGALGAIGASALAAAAVATLFLKPAPGAFRTPFNVPEMLARYRLVLSNPSAMICYGTVFFEGIAVFGVVPFVADLLESRHAGGPMEAGIVIAGIALGGLIYSLLARYLVKRLGPYGMMLSGGAVAALGLIVFAASRSWPPAAAGFALIGCGLFTLHTSVQSRVIELAPTARGSATALHAFSFFLGQAAGPPIFGLGLRSLGAPMTLAGMALIMAAAGVFAGSLLHTVRERYRPQEPDDAS